MYIFMLNTNALVYPTPSNGNLRPQSDGLAMLKEGGNDLNRFFFFKDLPRGKINNDTSNPFNHTRSTGGYNNDGTTLTSKLTANARGGIVPFSPLPSKQNTGKVSNGPVPVLNALVDWRINPKMNKLVDAPLPPQINPMAVHRPIIHVT